MTRRVLVAGVGNLFLGDDGFGPEVVRRLVGPGQGALPDGVRVVDYGIRGVHLAYDLLEGYDALVLVDAVPGDGPAGEVSVLEVGPDDLVRRDLDAHGMDPLAVLSSLGDLGGTLPHTYVVGCTAASVAEGIGLSPPLESAVAPTVDVVRRLVRAVAAGAEVSHTSAAADHADRRR